jgi:hypothetical protein
MTLIGREHDFGLSALAFEFGQQLTHGLSVTLGGDQHSGVED